jgi:phage repressor protein C with HTH and peptisase S24 domain
MDIYLRIKELREDEKLSKKDFSAKIGIDNSQYGKIEAGKLTPTIQQIMEISSIFGVSTDWLLTGTAPTPRNQPVPYDNIEFGTSSMAASPEAEYVRIKPEAATIPDIPDIPDITDTPERNISMYRLKTDYFNQERQPIPLYEIAASAGLSSIFDSQIQQVPLDYIVVPNAPKCDGALYVRGDSMYPVLKAGDIICYKTIHNIQNMVFGEMYLLDIDTGDDRILSVKYVQKSDRGDDFIKLVSENRYHTDRDEPLSHIKALALVKLSIRYNTIS